MAWAAVCASARAAMAAMAAMISMTEITAMKRMKFNEMIENESIKEDFNNSQAFILTPGEVRQLTPEVRKNCFVVFLDIDRSIRESRISNRQDHNDSIKRRLDADEIDFKNFTDYDLKITDPEFDVDSILSLMI